MISVHPASSPLAGERNSIGLRDAFWLILSHRRFEVTVSPAERNMQSPSRRDYSTWASGEQRRQETTDRRSLNTKRKTQCVNHIEKQLADGKKLIADG
jgi:hypothetical protein